MLDDLYDTGKVAYIDRSNDKNISEDTFYTVYMNNVSTFCIIDNSHTLRPIPMLELIGGIKLRILKDYATLGSDIRKEKRKIKDKMDKFNRERKRKRK